jgi:hypothetical protein
MISARFIRGRRPSDRTGNGLGGASLSAPRQYHLVVVVAAGVVTTEVPLVAGATR